ncbi:hypothetical protein G9A89_004091 [Geosiphon pyriformis]|nr:hypothetical protein G9A89_004091 [Geosiphon pyriformis]
MQTKKREDYKYQQQYQKRSNHLLEKKTRVESPTNPLYHYTLKSAINILSIGMSISNVTSTFGQLPFQSKQKKAELLEIYSDYFKGFKSQSTIPSGYQSPPPPPDFRTANL